jgi:hypothetical protein
MNISSLYLLIVYPFLATVLICCIVFWRKTIWAGRVLYILFIDLFIYGVAYQISKQAFGLNFRYPFFFTYVCSKNGKDDICYNFGWNNLTLFILFLIIVIFSWYLLENRSLNLKRKV